MTLSRIRLLVLAASASAIAGATVVSTASATPVLPPAKTAKPATHTVKMITEDGKQLFDPVKLTIKQGDVVEWLAVSGSHNVAFWEDSVPKGSPDLLQKAMPETTKPLTGPRKPTKGDKYVMTFANMPKGTYKYYCTPHLKKGMVAELTIQ